MRDGNDPASVYDFLLLSAPARCIAALLTAKRAMVWFVINEPNQISIRLSPAEAHSLVAAMGMMASDFNVFKQMSATSA